MPSLPTFKSLAKSDRRKEWAALKQKHRQAIAARGLKFDAKLGQHLDKYQAQLAVVNKAFDVNAVNKPAIQKLLNYSRPLGNLANYYQDKVKGLGNPAEKELTAFLKQLESDCQAWETAQDLFEDKLVATVTAAQLKAVQAVAGVLDPLAQQLVNLRQNVPLFQAKLKKIPKEVEYTKYQAKNPTGMSARQFRQHVRTLMDLLASSAVKLAAARTAIHGEVELLYTAAYRFNASSDYHSFKERAQKFAASAPLAAFQLQAQALGRLTKDDQFLPKTLYYASAAEVTRAGKSAREAGEILVDQARAEIQKLP